MSASSRDQGKREISFALNGKATTVRAHPMERLLDVLRHRLQLTGTKEGCGEGECGSCAVLMDDTLVNSCLIPALQAHGADIFTIEGLVEDGRLDLLQQAFLRCGAAQCGICTPGMILAGRQVLSKNFLPKMEALREGLSGNLCRCTGYMQIFAALGDAATSTLTDYETDPVDDPSGAPR